MWSTLRSDLSEFVSTVTEDTTTALNKIDANFDDDDNEQKEQATTPEEEEALRRMKLPETYTAPLEPSALGEEEQSGEEDNDDDDALKEVEEYLESFSIDSKTDEIAKLLEEHPDTLKAQFEQLVPTTVTYEEFWQRYFYRCDVDRITREWDEEGDDDGDGPINALGNLLGGAVKAVSARMGEDDLAETPVSGIFHGGTGRPPFVLNSAVDETDDDEEELGWDDDEEDFDDDDEEEDEDVDDSVEQIEFKDKVTERLQEQLKQALEVCSMVLVLGLHSHSGLLTHYPHAVSFAFRNQYQERDQLHETVEMQSKEIAALNAGDGESVYQKEVEKLKMLLFEKDSELAAQNAKMLDTSRVEEPSQMEAKLAALTKELEVKDAALKETEAAKTKITELEQTVSRMSKECKVVEAQFESGKEIIAQMKNEKAELESKLAGLQNQGSDLTAAAAQAKEATEARASSLEAELKSAQAQLGEAEKRTAAVESELEVAKEKLAAAEQRATAAEAELKGVQEKLAAAEARAASLESKLELAVKKEGVDEKVADSSADTSSTGVKVDTPAPGATKLPVDDVEDDWGDDWGDDDDL